MIVAQPWLELLRLIKSSWPRSNYVTGNWQEVSNDSLLRGVPAVQFHNIPSGTYDTEICQSYMTELSSLTSAYVLVQWRPLQKLW